MRSSILARLGIAGAVLFTTMLAGFPHQRSTAQEGEWPPFHALRLLDLSFCEEALSELTDDDIARLNGLVLEQPIVELTAAMDRGELTAYELTLYYLHRIRTYDLGQLNAVIELNQDALDLARTLDEERTNGTVRGPLHGIPVLLKDNISTDNYLHTTAGAVALQDAAAHRDAFLVTRLRQAGAIILGKANMTEWANWMHSTPANGYSALGGQVVSPYLDWLDPSGSSSGSAVAVSANLAPLAIGTETIGSIISPASRSGVVGFKPSLGLVSRDMLIPISTDFESAGPIGLTVSDVALAMTVLAASGDLGDPMTAEASPLIGADFSAQLTADRLQGARIGIVAFDPELSDTDQIDMYALWDEIAALEAAGAEVTIVRPEPFPLLDFETFFSCELGYDVNAYLANVDAGLETLAGITAYNEQHPWVIPYGQDRLYEATACTLSREETEALGADLRLAAREYLDALFTESRVDILLSIDDLFSLQYALAGYPAITLPHGTTGEGIPSGLTLIGRHLSDVELLGYAYAFEQTGAWRVPPPMVAAILPAEAS